MISKNDYLLFKTSLVLVFSMIYSFVELKTPFYEFINPYIYRVIYFILFFAISLTPSLRLTFAYFFISMTLEDAFYWILANQLPFSYAWYYPVIDHIPIDDIVEVAIAVVLLSIKKGEIKVPEFHAKCDMRYWFFHGKTHDLYGLLILGAMNIILYLYTTSTILHLISITDLVIVTGIFVDLWSHCFHH